MQVISVNIGKIQLQPWRDGTLSGLLKSPVNHAVAVSKSGLAGDEQADLKNHGGEDKAVFVMPASHYAFFKIEQPFGFLGENLTITELDESQVCLGDRLQIGNVLLEVSQPRSPCWKLGEQAQSASDWTAPAFLTAYSQSGRVGFYCRVIATGQVVAGQTVNWLTRNESNKKQMKKYPRIAIQKLFLAKQFHQTEADWQLLAAAVKHPALSAAWQQTLTNLLANRPQ